MSGLRFLAALVLIFVSGSTFAAETVVEVYCLDQTTRRSYGVSGSNLKIESGAFIDFVDSNGVNRRVDLKKGECELRVSTIPDPYEG